MDSKAGKHGRMRMTRVIALLVVAILAVGLPASALGQPDASAAKAKKHKRSSCRKKAKKSGVDKKRAKHKSSCKKKKHKKATPTPPAENPVVPPVTPTPAPRRPAARRAQAARRPRRAATPAAVGRPRRRAVAARTRLRPSASSAPAPGLLQQHVRRRPGDAGDEPERRRGLGRLPDQPGAGRERPRALHAHQCSAAAVEHVPRERLGAVQVLGWQLAVEPCR